MTGKAQIRLIRDPAEVCGHIGSALLHKLPDLFRVSLLIHIIQGGCHKGVALQAVVHGHKIHIDPRLPERLIVIQNAVDIADVLPRSRDILQGPPVLPVKDHCRLRSVHCAVDQSRYSLQPLSKFCHLAECPRIASVLVSYHSPVELLERTAPLTPLEILYRIRSVGDRLHG